MSLKFTPGIRNHIVVRRFVMGRMVFVLLFCVKKIIVLLGCSMSTSNKYITNTRRHCFFFFVALGGYIPFTLTPRSCAVVCLANSLRPN